MQCLDLAKEGALVDAEGLGRFEAVPLLPTQHVRDEDRFQFFHVHGLTPTGGFHALGQAKVFRQVMRLDQSRFAEDKGVFDDVLKLSDIARVVIGDQTGQGFAG